MDPELAQLDRLLDDDELFLWVKADLSKRHPNSEDARAPLDAGGGDLEDAHRKAPLRLELTRDTERNVSDSLVLRQFCRLYLERRPTTPRSSDGRTSSALRRWAPKRAGGGLGCRAQGDAG